MSTLHEPMKVGIASRLAALDEATASGDGDAVFNTLMGVCAALARDSAQRSWTLNFDAEDRDDLMKDDEDALVFAILKGAWSKAYPELPGQIEGALRDSFDDEHFRLEDPEGWAEINDEGRDGSEAAQ